MNSSWIFGVLFLFFIAIETGIAFWLNLGKGEYVDREQHE
ncbi:DUF4407 domain-containing protein [Peribacillus huizhouensis]|uniref:Uncharacterized protein n=1 Tax=Peribacillus huizhouensis TaxID=1501239 RepID=A0ABR6CQK6_9BACI|nr:DUF4407 domain-containing protein [Peribacillus huizhouensis]MBA9027322.1 hypothetical protein [Peribacillus huizhouensis]